MSPITQHLAHIENCLTLHARDWPSLAHDVRKYACPLPKDPYLFDRLRRHLHTPLCSLQETFVAWLLWEHIGDSSHLRALQHHTFNEFVTFNSSRRSELLNSSIPLLTTARSPFLQSLYLFDSLLLTHMTTMGLNEHERIEVLPQGHIAPIELKRICPTLYPWLNELKELHNWDTDTIRLLIQNAYNKEDPLDVALPFLKS